MAYDGLNRRYIGFITKIFLISLTFDLFFSGVGMAQAVESTSISIPINREISNKKNGAEYSETKNAIS